MKCMRRRLEIISGTLTSKSTSTRKTSRHSQKVLKKRCRGRRPKFRKAVLRFISLNRTFKNTTRRVSGYRKSYKKRGYINRRTTTKVNRMFDYNYKNVLMLL
jgi:hypothetical protein